MRAGGGAAGLAAGGTVLFVCGASSAFLGLIGDYTGAGALFGSQRSKATAIVGLSLSLLGMCLFFGVLGAIQRGAAP